MTPSFELYKIAVNACVDVYDKNKSLGTTQYDYSLKEIDGILTQIISVAGTNELGDIPRNLNLWSRKGIKVGAYEAALEIIADVELIPDVPLAIFGHSKGGATAIALTRILKSKKPICVVFSPARCLRYWINRTMKNVIMFIEPDDWVTQILGIFSFGLPRCKIIKAPKDHWLYSIGDHKMKHWKAYVMELIS